MPRERLYLFDTTLRDGAQTNGVDFTLADKLAIARMLDELGVDYVEGGYPGANPTDTQFFAEQRTLKAHVHRLRHDAPARPLGRRTIRALPRCSTPRPTRSASSPSPGTITCASRSRPRAEENLASIRDSVRAAKAKGREVLLDCEHFFDGYKANPAYALACAKAAYDAGARWVVLCDTNGGTLPHEVETIVGEVVQAHSRRPCRHPCPQRHRAGGGELARRGARRRAADPGHAQRPRRALRQRQSRLHHPDAEAQAGICRALRDRRHRTRSSARSPRVLARARRAAQPRRQPPRALCRRERVRHQGRHPCLGDHEGPGDLRACRARARRQPAQAPGLRSGRPLERPGRAGAHRLRGRQGRSAASRACSTRSRSARRSAMPTRRRTPRSSCWRGGMLGKVPKYLRRRAIRRQCRAAHQRQAASASRLSAWRW